MELSTSKSVHVDTRSLSSISGKKYELNAVVRIHSMRVATLTLCTVSTVDVDLSTGERDVRHALIASQNAGMLAG